MGKLEELTQEQMQPLPLSLTSLSGGASTDWVREDSGLGRKGRPGIVGIYLAIWCQVYLAYRIFCY